MLSAVAPMFGIFFHNEVNLNLGDQLSMLSADAPFLRDLFSRGLL